MSAFRLVELIFMYNASFSSYFISEIDKGNYSMNNIYYNE